jgi:hypothetical protein
MSLDRRRLFTYSFALVVLSYATYYVGATIYVWWHIPEAYAAWDTGTLLVRYMEKHDGDWPDGWRDLEQLHDDEPHLRLRWNAHEPDYFDQMRKMVAIDWEYDPTTRIPEIAVTSVDGSPLVCLWSDPNGMINYYLDRKDSPVRDPLVD